MLILKWLLPSLGLLGVCIVGLFLFHNHFAAPLAALALSATGLGLFAWTLGMSTQPGSAINLKGSIDRVKVLVPSLVLITAGIFLLQFYLASFLWLGKQWFGWLGAWFFVLTCILGAIATELKYYSKARKYSAKPNLLEKPYPLWIWIFSYFALFEMLVGGLIIGVTAIAYMYSILFFVMSGWK